MIQLDIKRNYVGRYCETHCAISKLLNENSKWLKVYIQTFYYPFYITYIRNEWMKQFWYVYWIGLKFGQQNQQFSSPRVLLNTNSLNPPNPPNSGSALGSIELVKSMLNCGFGAVLKYKCFDINSLMNLDSYQAYQHLPGILQEGTIQSSLG